MELFRNLERNYGLPSGLLDSVWNAESARGRRMLSPAGAQGHFQFMPATAKQYGLADPSDLTQSATAAAQMYADLLKQTGGDLSKALAGYNWGIGNVQRRGMDSAPTETRNYIQKVMAGMGQPQSNQQDPWAGLMSEFSQTGGQERGAKADPWAGLMQEFQQPAPTDRSSPKAESVSPHGDMSALITGQKPKRDVGVIEGTVAGVGRGFKDVLDTGAQWLSSGFDKIAGTKEGERVRAMNEQGKSEFKKDYGDSTAASFGRVGGNIAATWPVGGILGAGVRGLGGAVGASRYLEPLAQAVSTGGMRAAGMGGLPGLGVRAAGGAISGGATAGLVDPESAKTGAIVGALLPGGVLLVQKGGQLIKSGAKHLLGATTGTSAETMGAAYNAGRNGSQAFLDNMRGVTPFDDVVDAAKTGLNNMRKARADQYRSGMVDISKDKTRLDFGAIDDALNRVIDSGTYKGQQVNRKAGDVLSEIKGTIDNWRRLDPAEYHTPEGIDALKRALGDIRGDTQFGTSARVAADSIYNSVKGEIAKQAPTYNRVMSDYSRASGQLDEVTRALSLGEKASKDTAIRKLQSLMRNNAQTSYGNRLSLAQQLEDKGGVQLIPSIAGQALNSWTPRGMAGSIQKGAIPAVMGASIFNPALAATLAATPLTSPRLMGETLYLAGRAASGTSKAAKPVVGLLSSPEARQQIERGVFSSLPLLISTSPSVHQ